MKNVFKVFGNLNRAHSAKVPLLIIALVAVIGFSMAACDDDSDDSGGGGGGGGGGGSSNPLIGTWSYFYQGQINETITFTDTAYEWKDVNYGGLATYEKGTYTGVTGNSGTLTFNPTQKRDNTGNLVNVSGTNAYPYVYVYSLVGNNLVLDSYTYTK